MKNFEELMIEGKTRMEARRDELIRKNLLSDEFLELIQKNKKPFDLLMSNIYSVEELCQVLCAYRLFLPFAGITVSSRESAAFRNGITKICATKVSAGVSTGIGDHEEKYEGKEDADAGDEQFEINDSRSFAAMYQDMEQGGLQPVLNDYLYV